MPDLVDQKREPDQQHLKLKLNFQQPQPPSNKIKLHIPQKVATPPAPAPSPPAPAPPAAKAAQTPPIKPESPVLAPQPLPPRPAPPARQGSPLKNQLSPNPSKSPPSLRPAPPKAGPPPPLPAKDAGIPLGEWAKTPSTQVLPPRPMLPVVRPGPATPSIPQGPSKTGVVIPPSTNGVQPLQNIMLGTKRERSLTLIPLVTISTTSISSPVSTTSTTSTSQSGQHGLLLSITSPAPPAQSTQTLCLTVPRDIADLMLNAYLTKDLTLHGSYTFTVSANGRKLSPTVWPDASRRSGTTDSIAVLPRPGNPPPSPSTGPTGTGDTWKFTIPLGDKGSVTSIEASCTAFLKRDDRGLLVRGERSRTGQAAGEDGGELERIVILVLRGR